MKKTNLPVSQNGRAIPKDPRRVLPFLRHLVIYGEASQAEVRNLGSVDWVPLLAAGGLLMESDNGTYIVSLAWLTWLSQAPEVDLWRAACFSYPAYHRYLVGVLAQGFLEAGQADLYPRLENWIVGQVPHLAREINVMLETVEIHLDGQRPLMAEPGAVSAAFQLLPERSMDFAGWDQALLGLSDSPQAIFVAVLDKFGPLSAQLRSLSQDRSEAQKPTTTRESPESYGSAQTLLPAIPLRDEDGQRLDQLSPAPWNVRRSRIQRSLPLFAANGAPLFDPARPVREVLQDALFEQPFYRAVIHMAVDVTFARRSGEERLTLLTKTRNDLETVVVMTQNRQVGTLPALLPALVGILGFQPIPARGPLEASRVAGLLDNLLLVDVLELTEGELRLTDAYTTSLLNPPRLQNVVRAGRVERKRLVEYLMVGE